MPDQVLKNLNLFVDGRGYAGQVEEVNLPKLTIKTEDFRAGGMDAPIALDMGMEKLELSFGLISYDRDVLNLFGFIVPATVAFTFRGALENQDGSITAMVCKMRGSIREIDPGTSKAGDKPSLKVTCDLVYFYQEHDGQPVIEVDAINMIRMIGGVDKLAAVRKAIGL
jgi:P2 family phage contractile tail tube protein